MSLRVAPHDTTGVSPSMLMFGRRRNIQLPPVLTRGPIPFASGPRTPRSEYHGWLHRRLEDRRRHRWLTSTLSHSSSRQVVRVGRECYGVPIGTPLIIVRARPSALCLPLLLSPSAPNKHSGPGPARCCSPLSFAPLQYSERPLCTSHFCIFEGHHVKYLK